MKRTRACKKAALACISVSLGHSLEGLKGFRIGTLMLKQTFVLPIRSAGYCLPALVQIDAPTIYLRRNDSILSLWRKHVGEGLHMLLQIIARRGCYKIPRLEKCPIPSFGIDVMRPATYNPSTQTSGIPTSAVLTKQCELFVSALSYARRLSIHSTRTTARDVFSFRLFFERLVTLVIPMACSACC